MNTTLTTTLSDEQLLAALSEPEPQPKRPGIGALVTRLKQEDQDHEFYPTTEEIIRALVKDIGPKHERYDGDNTSVLDIGAGNGKVLMALRDRTNLTALHAMEKSSILCAELDPSILVVGTDFEEQSLFSKHIDVIFSNPPYSVYERWTEKIIRQSACKRIYLVIPQRWENSVIIADALKFRGFTARKIGAFDFEDAEDRTARAKVHLLRIDAAKEWNGYRDRGVNEEAFEKFFEEQFADLIKKFEEANPKKEGERSDDDKAPPKGGRTRPFQNLVAGPNYPEALVGLYQAEMDHINRNYNTVAQLDVDLLREFEIFPKKIMEMLHARLKGLRLEYWNELFSRLNAITDRLTAGSRKSLMETLTKHVAVDFTVTNIYEVVIWVIKNANRYLESQLIETYQHMVDKCNVQMYKSNKKTWEGDGWRYNNREGNNTHYALDYRIVVHGVGGISTSSWGCGMSRNGLEERTNTFLGDLLTVLRNLGFVSGEYERSLVSPWNERSKWTSGDKREFFYNPKGGKELLFDVRAFQNGNLHIRFNSDAILALNVEYGRLRGWLRTPKEAAEELKDPKAAQYFRSNLQLASGNATLPLGAGDVEEAA